MKQVSPTNVGRPCYARCLKLNNQIYNISLDQYADGPNTTLTSLWRSLYIIAPIGLPGKPPSCSISSNVSDSQQFHLPAFVDASAEVIMKRPRAPYLLESYSNPKRNLLLRASIVSRGQHQHLSGSVRRKTPCVIFAYRENTQISLLIVPPGPRPPYPYEVPGSVFRNPLALPTPLSNSW